MTVPPTLLSIILDKSYSMEHKRDGVIAGFNQLMAEQQQEPGMARMMITAFNGVVEPPTPAIPIHEIAPLTRAAYQLGPGTALFDAIAKTVRHVVAEVRSGERVMCLIFTDGEENASRETTLRQVREMIQKRLARGNWTFRYYGAVPDRWSRETGMPAESTARFADDDPRESFREASREISRFRQAELLNTRELLGPEPPADPPADDRKTGPRLTDA
jgi:hypothetical protein